MKIKNLSADIHFLNLCLQKDVSPKFLNKLNKVLEQIGSFQKAVRRKVLQFNISKFYQKRACLELEAYNLHVKLSNKLDGWLWQSLEKKLYDLIHVEFHKKKDTLKKKLWCLKGPESKKKRENNFINLSDCPLSKMEERVLSRGLKTCHTFSKKVEDYVVDVDLASSLLPKEEKEAFKRDCLPLLNLIKEERSDLKKKEIEYFKVVKQLKSRNLVVMKADKGNQVVVMNKNDYVNRTQRMLDDGDFVQVIKDPTNDIAKKVSNALKAVTVMDDKTKARLKASNPVTPKLYTLPKTHKQGEKMRPIVSNIDSPTYSLAKWLNKSFLQLGPINSMSVKNSNQFINEVQDTKISEDQVMVSFDVESLFPSVPIRKTLDILKKWLLEKELDEKIVNNLVNLTEICTENRFFQFNGKIYKQEDGLTMGNPLSPFLAELFMSDLERKIKNGFNWLFNVWRRFVDDVFSILKRRNLDDALKFLNLQEKSVKFTYEVENNEKLSFLDLMVHRQKGMLNFDIFRKGTHTDIYISNDSYNPPSQKLSIFNSLIHRMLSVPLSPMDRSKEEQRILEIAVKNGFQVETVRNLIRKKEFRKRVQEVTTLKSIREDEGAFVKICYHPNHFSKFKKVFLKYHLKAVPVNRHNLKSVFHGDLKDQVREEDRAGIYSLKCKDCDKQYIGQTRRKMKVRIKEHQRCIKNREIDKSAVALHNLETGHRFEEEGKLLIGCNDRRKLNILEAMEMHKKRDKLVNLDLECLENCLLKVIGSTDRFHTKQDVNNNRQSEFSLEEGTEVSRNASAF
ncbi:uncharacterized protein [Bemisia tabaci]|uniref:uncharacterized protein n=1 Tax=Bemisia tabaci TaxID=7038 RepID=UPI003B2828B3